MDAHCDSSALLSGAQPDSWQSRLVQVGVYVADYSSQILLFILNRGVQNIEVQWILWQISLVNSQRVLCSQLYAIASRTPSQRRYCLSSLTGVWQLLRDRRGSTTSTPTLNWCHPRHPKGPAPSHRPRAQWVAFTLLQKVKCKCEGWEKKHLNCCKYLGVISLVLFFQIPHHEWTLFRNWEVQPYLLIFEDEISKGIDKNSTVESRESCLVYIWISFHL